LSSFFDQLFVILVNGGIVLGLFVILLLNNRGVRKSRANLFLSVLLAAFTFSIFHIRYAGNVLGHFAPHIYFVGDPTFLLITPLLWFYIKELTGKHVKFELNSVIHFLPFLLIVVCSLTFQSLPKDSALIIFLRNHSRIPVIIFWSMAVIQFSAYQFFIHRKWQSYQQIIKQEVSNTEDINLSWIRFFIGVFLVITIFFFFGLFIVIHFDFNSWLWKGVGIIFSLSVFALGYKGILQREIFFTALLPEPVFTSSAKSVKPDQLQIVKLRDYMESKRPYLDSDLSLSVLAHAIEMNRSQLSQLINEGIGENFYDFVNKYRVEEVKRLMVDPEMKNFNLLGIALEAGFKSKSTFNLIFKRFTGLTPTEYRKNLQS
jgi:AraC-like DNA-binding protein